ncbi:hypothetical protein MH215_05325 [Paenibacillus sp. ACRSA]|uniref:hypothetical protein n=1 Tax=Paenibacillus sp. ACRSA TaxID=2918211 RepID=UPI001EF73160|nr:hypothetical protein [Paenibacillus sp. ACRSA]MCG7376405.1 hypothetical protein [Paenibacillus sp. ACRSA]
MEMGKDYRNPSAWNGKDGFNPDPPGAHVLAPEKPKFGTFPGYTTGLNKYYGYGIKVGEEWDEL